MSIPFPLVQRQEEAANVDDTFRPDLAVRLLCSNCPPNSEPNIVEEYSSGDLVCGNCGLVLGDRVVDTRSEWRTFAGDEGGDDPSRVGAAMNPLLDGASAFSLDISFRDGRSGISKSLQNAAARVAVRSGERSLGTAYGEITTLCDKLSMTRQLQDTAKQLFRRQDEEKICRGKSRDAIVAACIFLAARISGDPRSFKQIMELTGVDKKRLGACYQLLKTAFDATAAIDQSRDASGLQSSASAAHHVARFSNHLGLPAWIGTVARNVCLKIMDLGRVDGRSPLTVAGTAIYFATALLGAPKSAAQCAEITGMAPGTIQHAYRCVVPSCPVSSRRTPFLRSLVYPDREAIVGIPELKRYVADGRADIARLPVVRTEGPPPAEAAKTGGAVAAKA